MISLSRLMTHPFFLPRILRDATLVVALFLMIVVNTHAQSGSDEVLTIDLRISNHLFIPARLMAPANTRFRLRVINEDKTPEEFESAALNREKVIMGGSEGIIFLGPLAPGIYSFFGEFNPRTAQGSLIVEIP